MDADGKKPIEGSYHAVSLSGGKDNEKKIKMERTSLKMRKEPEASSKLFP